MTEQVAGDLDAGFPRPVPVTGDDRDRNDVTIEAYRWSGLTGGTASRTFSLVLLLPFMLGNIATWMLPVPGRTGAPARALVRLLGASLTAMYVLSTVGVALDLIAWQCLGYPRCFQDRRAISWLAGTPAGQELAVLSVLPLAAIAGMWFLGARTWQLPETRIPVPGHDEVGSLDHPAFWDNRLLLHRLRAVHLAAALGTLDTALLYVLAAHDRRLLGYVLLAATGLVLAAAFVTCCLPAIECRDDAPGLALGTKLLSGTAVTLTALVVAYAAAPRSPWRVEGGLPGYDRLVAVVFVGQMFLLGGLAVVVLVQRRRFTRPAVLGGLGAPVVILIAIGFAVSYSSALVYAAAEYLDRGSSPTPVRPLPLGAPPLAPPVAFRWAALGFSTAVLVGLLIAVLRGFWHRSARRGFASEVVRRDYPEADEVPTPRVEAVRDAIARARVADRLGPLAPAGYAVLAVVALGAAGSSVLHLGPGDLARRLGGESLARPVDFVTDLGVYLIGAFALVLAVSGLFAYRSRGIRLIGVLWDLATFWPRAAHPLAPPCYSERAVPDLVRRTRYLTAGGGVVLSGESHGSILAAVTVLQLPPSCHDRVALVTYACPLRRLYARVFPAYVDENLLRDVGARLTWRWINLWQYTDPIGGWVFVPEGQESPGPGGRVDRRVRDPAGLLIPPGDTVPPPIGRHRFRLDEQGGDAVRELTIRMTGRPTGGQGHPPG
ncbi:hypothetical protein [Micromonospora echinospora]|uniref:hypothetical protein n=1 Tax=Micromonospora echinospora TaxID=1877 RepID=UPI00366C78A4